MRTPVSLTGHLGNRDGACAVASQPPAKWMMVDGNVSWEGGGGASSASAAEKHKGLVNGDPDFLVFRRRVHRQGQSCASGAVALMTGETPVGGLKLDDLRAIPWFRLDAKSIRD